MRATNRTTAADKPRNKPATHWAAAENFSRWAQMADEAIAELGMTWPLDREQAVEVARALEYDLRPELLPILAGRGFGCDPYDQRTFVAILLFAECRGLWAPSPSRHDDKKPKARIRREQMHDSFASEVTHSLGCYDNLMLVAMLGQCSSKDDVLTIAEMLRERIDPGTLRFTESLRAMDAK